MHAIVVEQTGGPEVLLWKEQPDPTPGPGEVTIRVTLSGINFADIQRRKGGYRGSPPPFTPGLDCVGTILALGAGVTDFRVGQRVAAFPEDGGYTEIARAKTVLTYPLPDAVSDEAASASTMLVTAYNLLTMTTRMQRGETVAISAAAGGVGTIAIQMARALGAATIVGVAGGSEKLAVAREAGADVTIDHHIADVPARVKAAVGDRGVDVVLDSVAGPMFAALFPVLAPFGRYAVFGMASGEPGHVASNDLHMSNRAVLGYSTGGYRAARPADLRPGMQAALDLVASGAVNVVVGARYALKDAAEAQRHVESRASTGKVLLVP
ncbi:MAG TPA: zinc-binding dehydrogenase [Candidatus Sulfotelmatobacter sp.]|nr:zinc-binding dehydrogenase [Candidatus Sulfotelmatobacter sp.]